MQELSEQREIEKCGLLSEIQALQKDILALSSSSLAKEKESMRKDFEKTKAKLKETEFKLKNTMQEKTKLEVLPGTNFCCIIKISPTIRQYLVCRVKRHVLREK